MEKMDSCYKILDVNTNRIGESLRVLEDLVRFRNVPRQLVLKIKILRHKFKQIVSTLPYSSLIKARNVKNDRGKKLYPLSEASRINVVSVIQANVKRLQEASRSLEENSKLISPNLGKNFKGLRFEFYQLEKELFEIFQYRKNVPEGLYIITDDETDKHILLKKTRLAINGGAKTIQLRSKKINRKNFLDLAENLRKITAAKKVLLIINDYIDIAQIVDADGVHLGQDDISISEARKILGHEKIIGVSTHSLKQAIKAEKEGANYISVGPIFSSPTKPHLKPVGLNLLKQIKRKIKIPIVAIGGINLQNISKTMKLDVKRAAVISAVMNAKNPAEAVYQFKKKML
jgi:thiamine-phosphate pyrophosphorylase